MQIPAIIDIEASGFGRGSYPIEVGFALPDRTSYSFLIKPAQSWTHWSEDAEKSTACRASCCKEGLAG